MSLPFCLRATAESRLGIASENEKPNIRRACDASATHRRLQLGRRGELLRVLHGVKLLDHRNVIPIAVGRKDRALLPAEFWLPASSGVVARFPRVKVLDLMAAY